MATPYNNNDNDLFNDDNVQATMMKFGNGMQLVMENFKNCTERIRIRRSSIMSNHVRETRLLRNMFREFVDDSLEFNNRLENYSLDILFFVRCFKNNNYSNQDIRELMNDLLRESHENLRLSRELKNKLKTDEGSIEEPGINNRLISIQNSLPDHIENIRNEINSDRCSALIPTGGGLISALTRHVISMFLDVRHLYLKLDELAMVKDFDNNLKSIIMEIGKIETFWDMQVRRIEYLNGNLSSGRSGRNDIQRRRIIHNLERKWKNVEKECKIYNRVMRDLLNRDNIMCIE